MRIRISSGKYADGAGSGPLELSYDVAECFACGRSVNVRHEANQARPLRGCQFAGADAANHLKQLFIILRRPRHDLAGNQLSNESGTLPEDSDVGDARDF